MKGNPVVPGGPLTSKPAWLDASGRSTRSAFFVRDEFTHSPWEKTMNARFLFLLLAFSGALLTGCDDAKDSSAKSAVAAAKADADQKIADAKAEAAKKAANAKATAAKDTADANAAAEKKIADAKAEAAKEAADAKAAAEKAATDGR